MVSYSFGFCFHFSFFNTILDFGGQLKYKYILTFLMEIVHYGDNFLGNSISNVKLS